MAVQAQHSSNILLLNRCEQEKKSMGFSQAPAGFLDPFAVFLSNGVAASGNPRKRGREAAPMPTVSPANGNSLNILSLQPPPAAPVFSPAVVSLAQLQARPPPAVSTGLHLAFEDQHQLQNLNQADPLPSSSLFSSVLSGDLTSLLKQHQDEFDRFVRAQSEQLCRMLAEKRRRHSRALLCAAEAAAARRLREKEAEVDLAKRRGAELEERLARLKAESLAWQAKAMANQEAAVALHAQLQQAQAAAAAAEKREGECRDSPAEDAESANVNPDRASPSACRSCRAAPASVVLLPCCHLCLCPNCDSPAPCPVCRCATTGNLHVVFS